MILELAEQGLLPRDVLPLTPELAFRFCTYWAIVAHRRTQRPDVRLPFHHLSTGGFWSPLQEDGSPSPDDRLTHFAALTSDFVAFALDPASRDKGYAILLPNILSMQSGWHSMPSWEWPFQMRTISFGTPITSLLKKPRSKDARYGFA